MKTMTETAVERVFIAGLLPQQAGAIQQEFGDAFSLRFWKDESHSALKSGVASCDVGILFGSKSSHNTGVVMKAKCPRYIVVMGGLTSLKSKLTELFAEYSDAAPQA